MKRPFLFSLVGATGFAVDAIVLVVLTGAAGLGPYLARACAIAVALTTTWWLNRVVTFGASNSHVAVEGIRYGGVGLATSAFNYAVYAVLIFFIPPIPPLLALVLASAAAAVASYFGYSRLVFFR